MTGQNLEVFYAVYLATSIGLTTWLAVVLNRNGKIFLRDVFHDDPDVGEAVNRLLTIGFFMFNLGYAFLILRAESIGKNDSAVNFLVNRLGLLLVSLGVLHFINMAVFAKIRRRMQMRDLSPPVPPPVLIPPPGDPAPTGQPHPVTAAGPRGGGQPRATFIGPDLPPPPVDPWAPYSGR